MASNDRILYLPAVTDLSINGRQARGDTTGQSDHECMTFRSQSAVPGVAGEVEGILQQHDIGMLGKDCSGW